MEHPMHDRVERRIAWNTGLSLMSLAAVLALAAAIAVGALDRFFDEGLAKRSAIGALVAYWLVLFGIVWVIPFALRHPRQVGLCMVATAATLGLVEIGARIFLPGATVLSLDAGGFRSREFHHIYPAHARRYMGRFEGAPVFLETNEDGLRTRYSKEEFRKHDERVIFLGDSFTFGLGVTSEDTFPSRVEAQLRRAASDETVAVLNAGIVSYSPFLHKVLFEKKLVEYRPTLVVLFLDATDIGDDHAYMSTAERAEASWIFPFEEGEPVRYRGALGELIRPHGRRLMSALDYPFQLAGYQLFPKSPDYYDFEIEIGTVLEKNRYFIYRHPLDVTRPLFERTLRNIDEIAARASQLGAGFALAITPRYHHWNVAECPDNWEKDEYGLAEPYQFEFFRFFDEVRREYPIINLLPDFRATDQYPLVFADDPHWNAAGHAFVADTVTRHLLSTALPGPRATATFER
jgi:hypothetical protein